MNPKFFFNSPIIQFYSDLFTEWQISFSARALEGYIARELNSNGRLSYMLLLAIGQDIELPLFKQVDVMIKETSTFKKDKKLRARLSNNPLVSISNPVFVPDSLRKTGLNENAKELVRTYAKQRVEAYDKDAHSVVPNVEEVTVEQVKRGFLDAVESLLVPDFELSLKEHQEKWKDLAYAEGVMAITFNPSLPFCVYEIIQDEYMKQWEEVNG